MKKVYIMCLDWHEIAFGTLQAYNAVMMFSLQMPRNLVHDKSFVTKPVSNGPFYWHGLFLIPICICYYVYYTIWEEIT